VAGKRWEVGSGSNGTAARLLSAKYFEFFSPGHIFFLANINLVLFLKFGIPKPQKNTSYFKSVFLDLLRYERSEIDRVIIAAATTLFFKRENGEEAFIKGTESADG